MLKVAAIVLGCPKNTVEAEYLLGALSSEKFTVCSDINVADIIIVHTCSFISDARRESEESILKAVAAKRLTGARVFVSGCLPQLLKDKITAQFPEIDGYVGTASLSKLSDLIRNKKTIINMEPGGLNNSKHRLLSSVLPTAYLKIAEGCNHKCSFCIIPKIRGKYESRTTVSLVKEAEALCKAGIKELILIAQDTTSYGIDIYDAFALDKLLSKLAKIEDLKWIRLMYAYPSSLTDDVIKVIQEHKNICKYVDMPVQHVSKNVLKAMKRPENTRAITEKLKNKNPDIFLRTSLISGFPGETEKDAKELLDFVKLGYFDFAGVFEYSNEESASSSKMIGQIPKKVVEKRKEAIETAQSEVFRNKIAAMKGQAIEFVAESRVKQNAGFAVSGRSYFQAPEIDGNVIVKTKNELKPGSFHKGKVLGNDGYNILLEKI